MILCTGPKSPHFDTLSQVRLQENSTLHSGSFLPGDLINRLSLYLQNLRPQLVFTVKTLINHYKLKHVESSNKKLIELMSPLIG